MVLPHLLYRRAQQVPDHCFIRSGEEHLTYAQAHTQALQWAHALENLGIEADTQVADMLGGSCDSVLAWMGTAWLRARRVPIHISPGFRGRVLEHMLRNSEAQVLLISKAFLDRLDDIDFQKTSVRVLVVPDSPAPPQLENCRGLRVLTRAEFLDGAQPLERLGPEYNDIASITYTSGTTGDPKGATVYWAQLHAASGSPSQMIPPTRTFCMCAAVSASWMAAQTLAYMVAAYGGTLVLRQYTDPPSFLDGIRRWRCTNAYIPPNLIAELLQRPPSDADRTTGLKHVHTYFSNQPHGVEEFERRFGVRVSAGRSYSSTELGTPIASNQLRPGVSERGDYCGEITANYEARIVDRHDEVVPTGAVGELVVRARRPWIVFGGYYGMPEETLAAWRNGWYHTGDAFSCDASGRYFFVDRVEDLIWRRSGPISSRNIERAVAAHPCVSECAVVDMSHQGGELMRAFIVKRPHQHATEADVLDFLRQRLAPEMLPQQIEFRPHLPRAASEKVMKFRLREQR